VNFPSSPSRSIQIAEIRDLTPKKHTGDLFSCHLMPRVGVCRREQLESWKVSVSIEGENGAQEYNGGFEL
jgi:hypothetical protein